ncbi:hypothetical protein NP233_g2465 [Leucocoprinus birnbaumii]|uniref:Thiaminase-2/PQQC domain-containing protein n=1 Tax=Leucocoprinus birnbaumii TaxID=56174 RepID=A0AAD5W4I1_9AGAR|nr:hypothetical protein NP233_g2465 [Leucocoprinus birnbaumii]
MPTLTEHLANLTTIPPYTEAINHPFLVAAGNGSLPADRLALWLSQDRIYAAHAYPAFIGALITSIPWDSSQSVDSLSEQRNQHILSVLVFCLENIVREVNFFRDTATRWDLPIDDWNERKGTRDYTAEMARISKNGNVTDGLIFLWAMERVYLDAWSFVLGQIKAHGQDLKSSAAGSFATNWGGTDMIDFVDKLATLVDGFNIQPGSEAWARAEGIWTRVVELEVDFWPNTGEEVSQRKSPN